MRRDPVSAVFSTGNATTRAVPAVLIPIGLAELCAATSAVLGEDKLLRTSSPPTRGTAAVESRVALAPRLSLVGNRSGIRTGGRHADTTGTFTVNTLLLKAASAELASRLWDLPAGKLHFALLARLLADRLGSG